MKALKRKANLILLRSKGGELLRTLAVRNLLDRMDLELSSELDVKLKLQLLRFKHLVIAKVIATAKLPKYCLDVSGYDESSWGLYRGLNGLDSRNGMACVKMYQRALGWEGDPSVIYSQSHPISGMNPFPWSNSPMITTRQINWLLYNNYITEVSTDEGL